MRWKKGKWKRFLIQSKQNIIFNIDKNIIKNIHFLLDTQMKNYVIKRNKIVLNVNDRVLPNYKKLGA